MEQRKIVYEGICCHMKSKAAFVDWCLESSDESRMMIFKAMLDLDEQEEFFEISELKSGCIGLKAKWDDVEKERIFDTVIGKKLLKKGMDQFPQDLKILMKPALQLNNKDIQTDTFLYLVFAIVKNERCTKALKRYIGEETDTYYRAFRESVYNDLPVLTGYLLEDKYTAMLTIGFMVTMRREEAHGEKYQALMNILYAGYKPLKNSIKKMKVFRGDNLKDFLVNADDMVLNISRMIVQLVLADEFGVMIEEDYDYYMAVYMFQVYEKEWLEFPEELEYTKEGAGIYRKLKRERPHMESFYSFYFAENSEVDELELEGIFENYNLNIRMLAGLCLEQKDAEKLCSLYEDLDWNTYKHVLLIATLCKYIDQLQCTYLRDHPEEIGYQQKSEGIQLDEIQQEVRILRQKLRFLEQQTKEQKRLLEDAEAQQERRKAQILKMEQKQAREKEELIGLRNFVFQLGQTTKDAPDTWDIKDSPEQPGCDRMIVVGGHTNWQKKIKQRYPDSQFLASDNMNFDTSILRNKKYIVFNTDILKHSIYYKIMNQKKKEQKIFYVHGNNVDRTLQEIERQMQFSKS